MPIILKKNEEGVEPRKPSDDVVVRDTVAWGETSERILVLAPLHLSLDKAVAVRLVDGDDVRHLDDSPLDA